MCCKVSSPNGRKRRCGEQSLTQRFGDPDKERVKAHVCWESTLMQVRRVGAALPTRGRTTQILFSLFVATPGREGGNPPDSDLPSCYCYRSIALAKEAGWHSCQGQKASRARISLHTRQLAGRPKLPRQRKSTRLPSDLPLQPLDLLVSEYISTSTTTSDGRAPRM